MTTYPKNHQAIVADLLAGKFILEKSPLFSIVKDHLDFYTHFFKASYGYLLNRDQPYFFLTSQDTQEETSQDFILFLALLAYEYHNEQRDFVKEITENVLEVAEIDKLLKASSQYDALLRDTKAEDLSRFINTWHGRHLLTFVDKSKQRFRFNTPIHTFLQVAVDLADKHFKAAPSTQ